MEESQTESLSLMMGRLLHKSYGIVAYKKDPNGNLEFLLVKNKSGDHWGFPKGTPEIGEREIETARREFEEETGIKAPLKLSYDLLLEEYDFEHNGVHKHKINKYFWGIIEKEEKVGDVFSDINEIAWKNFEDALATLTFDRSKEILKKVRDIIFAQAQ